GAGRGPRCARRSRDQCRRRRDRPRAPTRPPLGRAGRRGARNRHPRLRRCVALSPALDFLRRRDARDALRQGAQGGEGKGGRRGATNVLANVSVAAFCALVAGLAPHGDGFRLAAAAALATALMDTVGTEVGQAITSPTALLPDLRQVPPGTDGAVSVAGTLTGLAAAALLAAAGVMSLLLTPRGAVAVVLAAVLGTVVESLLGRSGAL